MLPMWVLPDEGDDPAFGSDPTPNLRARDRKWRPIPDFSPAHVVTWTNLAGFSPYKAVDDPSPGVRLGAFSPRMVYDSFVTVPEAGGKRRIFINADALV